MEFDNLSNDEEDNKKQRFIPNIMNENDDELNENFDNNIEDNNVNFEQKEKFENLCKFIFFLI
mgnify:CR=1 FL=1